MVAVSRRYFCAKCGSPIAIDPATMPAVTFLSVGTLTTQAGEELEPQFGAVQEVRPGSASSRDAELPERHDRLARSYRNSMSSIRAASMSGMGRLRAKASQSGASSSRASRRRPLPLQKRARLTAERSSHIFASC